MTTTAALHRVFDRASSVPAALFAVLLGAFLVYGAGFAQSAALHDAAHDVRHASNFPCH